MTLLQKMADERCRRLENVREQVRRELWNLLSEILPGQRVIIFGSLMRSRRFNEYSDVDLALEAEPPTMSSYKLSSLIAERLGRRVDVLLLDESRFRHKIARVGELWTLPG